MDSGPIAERVPRVNAIDVARTIALIAMAIYHFSWDLAIFGYAAIDLPQRPGMIVFARMIAGSFIFLAGISLVLAHGEGIRWPSYRKRLLQIIVAAVLVTIATLIAFPETFIFFGILHLIALASLLGLAFLHLNALLTVSVAVFFLALPHFFRSEFFSAGPLLWLGLAETPRVSNDYVPLFPWFGVFLFGMAFGRIGRDRGWFRRFSETTFDRSLPNWLAVPGRHSLIVYLIHQPVLLALVWLAATLVPPGISIADVRAPCERSCLAQSEDAAFCTRYCGCILSAMDEEDLLYRGASLDSLTDEQLQMVDQQRNQCMREVDTELYGSPSGADDTQEEDSTR
ncbi:heparan-alpha-glucosaminide N-acetyltransferase [Notoacmeibacter ruber]|uniref:DUF1624 domain-containing protein n=1 Tax=Notoacmeibacter ruber TaxID=2670375 RepID=A0A3L7JB19_9HYPH|nr:heparan-alpha-glucosaminide N-acetyltransferase [Notoacmeibacter ruber]RLQ87948.1 DUF1624 domain-containing protein [Notoacmeibacter ruber]